MLNLKREEGQWLEIKHHSGDTIYIRVYDIVSGSVKMAFDDAAHNFSIERIEAKIRKSKIDHH